MRAERSNDNWFTYSLRSPVSTIQHTNSLHAPTHMRKSTKKMMKNSRIPMIFIAKVLLFETES
jgi:hypothetical protein